MDLKSRRGLVVDLLALFNCNHRLEAFLLDEEIAGSIGELFSKMNNIVLYRSKSQLKKYGERLNTLINSKKGLGDLARLIKYSSKDLEPDKESREWAEKLWKGGFHKDEYIELYAGIRSTFKNCSADCALLCIAEESEDKFEDLRNELEKLKKEFNMECEYISDKKVLLRKS
jgi:hypothetical protein